MPDKYVPTTMWTIAKNLLEGDSLNLVIPSKGRTWTYPRQIVSIWDKSDPEDKGTDYENQVCDKLCFLGTLPSVKYATCTDGEKLWTEEEELIVHTSWDFIFDTKEEAKVAFRNTLSRYKPLLEQTIAMENEMLLQAKQALAY